MSNIHDNLEVATTISEAAASIRKHSYAIYQVNDHETAHHQAIQQAWLQAKEFFATAVSSSSTRNDMVQRYQVIHNGHLLGFHEPSEAKLLFRAYCHDCPNQPWPSPAMQAASCVVATKLHDILQAVQAEMVSQIAVIATTTNKNEQSSFSTTRRSGTKRRREEETLSDSNCHDGPSTNVATTTATTATTTTATNCPLDYFFYHGPRASKTFVTSNCTPHTDRGYLVAVCLGNHVPGLQVLPATATSGSTTADYVCPEESTRHAALYSQADTACSNRICILAGDEWRRTDPDTPVQACVHRVRDDLMAARLSISYELRV